MKNTIHQDLIKATVASLYSNLFELVGDFNIGANLRQIADKQSHLNTFQYRIVLITRKAFRALERGYNEGKELGVDFGLYDHRIQLILNDEDIKEYIAR